MNFRKYYTSKIAIIVAVLVVAIFIFSLYWLHFLQVAHSSFENYYNFRGCIQLIEKTDTYGTCKTSSGEAIKIVKMGDKWYLDGDLPFGAVFPESMATSSDVVSTPIIPTPKSVAIVNGKVTLSPVCPVERIPPDPQCAPKLYATNIQIFSVAENKLIKTAKSGADGNFTVSLPFDNYKIQANGGNPYPRCNEVALSIKTSTTISINISCDTGIR